MTPEMMTAIADAAEALARVARAAAEQSAHDPGTLLSIRDAARVAGTTPRVLKDAIRAGALPQYGGQRDRSVRRGDLDAWVEARRVPVAAGPTDLDIDRRMKRIARSERATPPSPTPDTRKP